MSDETTRLRALLDGIALPLSSAQTDSTAIEIDDAEGTYVGSVDVDHGPGLDASESTETHAALIVAAVNALPVLLDAAEKADALLDSAGRRIANLCAERNAARVERDDLAAVLETRTAEHALAMARVRELEAIIAGRTTPPTDEGEGDGGETPAEIVARLRRHANEARRCAAWEHSQGMHLAAENSCRDARDFDAQADRMATAEVSRG